MGMPHATWTWIWTWTCTYNASGLQPSGVPGARMEEKHVLTGAVLPFWGAISQACAWHVCMAWARHGHGMCTAWAPLTSCVLTSQVVGSKQKRTRDGGLKVVSATKDLATHPSLLTTHYTLLTTHYCTAHSSLLTPHCSLLTAHCSLFTAHCSLPTPYYSLPTTHYSLPTTHYPLTHYRWCPR